MRVLIFSDLHGNWEALEALQRVERQPDALLFLGDIVDFGPDPKACLTWVRNNATASVRGNHDHAAAYGVCCECPDEYHDLAASTREHGRRVLNEDDLTYLAGLPTAETVELGGTRFHLAHGSPGLSGNGLRENLYRSLPLIESRQADLEAALDGVDADVVLLGHTHVPALRLVGHTLIVNPGSLGQPRYGMPDATYAVWEDGHLEIRHLHYPHAVTRRKLSLLPLDPEHMMRLQGILEKGM